MGPAGAELGLDLVSPPGSHDGGREGGRGVGTEGGRLGFLPLGVERWRVGSLRVYMHVCIRVGGHGRGPVGRGTAAGWGSEWVDDKVATRRVGVEVVAFVRGRAAG